MSIPIIDTHQHLIDPRQSKYSWTDAIPELRDRHWGIGEYLRQIEGTGINKSIFMESSPDAWFEEAPRIYALTEESEAGIAGVIASCRPEDRGFEKYLDSIENDKLVGLRRTCHFEDDELSRQFAFVENIRCLGQRDLTFDLCFLARQLPLALELARKCPNVMFVLDHCGMPDIRGGALDPWRDHMRQLARLPNVICKISGVLAYCDRCNATTSAVRPYVEHSIESFGWERVVWGSDWPVCNITATLRQWVATTLEIIDHATDSDKYNLFHANAMRVYGLR